MILLNLLGVYWCVAHNLMGHILERFEVNTDRPNDCVSTLTTTHATARQQSSHVISTDTNNFVITTIAPIQDHTQGQITTDSDRPLVLTDPPIPTIGDNVSSTGEDNVTTQNEQYPNSSYAYDNDSVTVQYRPNEAEPKQNTLALPSNDKTRSTVRSTLTTVSSLITDFSDKNKNSTLNMDLTTHETTENRNYIIENNTYETRTTTEPIITLNEVKSEGDSMSTTQIVALSFVGATLFILLAVITCRIIYWHCRTSREDDPSKPHMRVVFVNDGADAL